MIKTPTLHLSFPSARKPKERRQGRRTTRADEADRGWYVQAPSRPESLPKLVNPKPKTLPLKGTYG